MFGLLILVLLFALKDAMYRLWAKDRVLRIAALMNVDQASVSRGKISSVYVTRRDGMLHVKVDGFITDERLDGMVEHIERIRETVSKDVGEPVRIELDVIPARRFKFESKSPSPPPIADGG